MSKSRDHPSLSSSIFDLSLVQQSNFVDKFCYQNAEDTSFLSKQFKKPFDIKDINKINTTSIGNLAYLALNSVEPYKTLAKNDLQTIRKALKRKNSSSKCTIQ